MAPVCINSNLGFRCKDQQQKLQQKIVFETFPLLENKNNREELLMFPIGLLKPFQLSSKPQVV